MAELETLTATAHIRATLEDWEPGENVDTDAMIKDLLIVSIDLLDTVRDAVFEEWGHDWKTQPACRRVLGERVYDIMTQREQASIDAMVAYRQEQEGNG